MPRKTSSAGNGRPSGLKNWWRVLSESRPLRPINRPERSDYASIAPALLAAAKNPKRHTNWRRSDPVVKRRAEIIAWLGARIGKPPGYERLVRRVLPAENCSSLAEVC